MRCAQEKAILKVIEASWRAASLIIDIHLQDLSAQSEQSLEQGWWATWTQIPPLAFPFLPHLGSSQVFLKLRLNQRLRTLSPTSCSFPFVATFSSAPQCLRLPEYHPEQCFRMRLNELQNYPCSEYRLTQFSHLLPALHHHWANSGDSRFSFPLGFMMLFHPMPGPNALTP